MGILKAYKCFRAAALVIINIACIFLFSADGNTQPLQLQEQKIKAGLLYNFIKYSSWPAEVFATTDAPFQICLLEEDPFEGALDPMQGRTAQMRSINIRTVTLQQAIQCHVVFIGTDQERHLSDILSLIAHQPILTVSDIENFSEKGGMVEFSRKKQNKIQLFINNNAIRKAGLEISQPLLKLANNR